MVGHVEHFVVVPLQVKQEELQSRQFVSDTIVTPGGQLSKHTPFLRYQVALHEVQVRAVPAHVKQELSHGTHKDPLRTVIFAGHSDLQVPL